MPFLDSVWTHVNDMLVGIELATPVNGSGEESVPVRMPSDAEWLVLNASSEGSNEFSLPAGLTLGVDAPDGRINEHADSEDALVHPTGQGPAVLVLSKPQAR